MGRTRKKKDNNRCFKCQNRIPETKRSDAKYCSDSCRNAAEKARYCKKNAAYVKRQRKLVKRLYHRKMFGHTEYVDKPMGNKRDPYRAAREAGYRSGLEVSVARELEEKGIPFEYESKKIKWIDHRSRIYRPDFILPNKIIVETKGRFVAADRVKHLKIKEQFPEYDIRFVFQAPNSKLSKTSKTTYAQWCKRYGFEYAYKSIPDEWIKEETLDWRKLPGEDQDDL